MNDINSVRLAWVRRRMTIRDKDQNGQLNRGNIVVFSQLDGNPSNFTHEDLSRSVSNLAIGKQWKDINGFGVTEPNYVRRAAHNASPEDVVKIADLVDMWMLGL